MGQCSGSYNSGYLNEMHIGILRPNDVFFGIIDANCTTRFAYLLYQNRIVICLQSCSLYKVDNGPVFLIFQ